MKKTIFIVGAGKGLGTAIGRRFGKEDFRVVLMARNADSLNSYAEAFKAEGIEVYTKTADASDDKAMSKALSKAITEYGTPDVFAYNVGVTSPDSELAEGVTPAVLRERYDHEKKMPYIEYPDGKRIYNGEQVVPDTEEVFNGY